MKAKYIFKDGVDFITSYLKKSQRTTKVGEIEICTIFRGNKHVGSKVKYPDGATSETSVTNRFTLTQEGEFAPMRVYKTTTKLPDGTKIVEKNKLSRVGQNVEVQSTTTTSKSSSRHVKQPEITEKPAEQAVIPVEAEAPKTIPTKNKIKEAPATIKPTEEKLELSDSKNTFLGIRNDKDITGCALAFTYLGLIPACVGLFWWAVGKLPKADYDIPTKPVQEKPKTEEKEQTKEKQELIEYTPKRGENWISILKAKYGVDDATAKAMAHKIKDMCYDDSLAAKQTPIMYLPKVWKFNGKTYHYSDSVNAGKCKVFSDKVKTEMGKMSKDLQY